MPIRRTRCEKQAALKIDKGIAGKEEPEATVKAPPIAPSIFKAVRGKHRKPGTGCITQINENLWEGRYSPVWPDGKKHPRNIYAHSEEECEKLLAVMITEEKSKIAAEQERLRASSHSDSSESGYSYSKAAREDSRSRIF